MVTVRMADREIVLWVDSPYATVDGHDAELPVAPTMVQNRLMVSMDFSWRRSRAPG